MRLLGAFVSCAALLAQTNVPLEQLDLSKATSLAVPMGYPAKEGRSVFGTPPTGKVYEH